MDTLREWFERLTSGHLPAGTFAGVALLLLFIAFKAGKLITKLMFGLTALALLAGAAWWFLQKRG